MAAAGWARDELEKPVGSSWSDRQGLGKARREIATAVGIPKNVWNLGNGASPISEAAEAGVSDDDITKQSGHADKAIARFVYKRRGSEISRRLEEERRKHRARCQLTLLGSSRPTLIQFCVRLHHHPLGRLVLAVGHALLASPMLAILVFLR